MDFFTRPPHPITPKIKAPQNHLQLHFEIFQKSILKTYVPNAILVMHAIHLLYYRENAVNQTRMNFLYCV